MQIITKEITTKVPTMQYIMEQSRDVMEMAKKGKAGSKMINLSLDLNKPDKVEVHCNGANSITFNRLIFPLVGQNIAATATAYLDNETGVNDALESVLGYKTQELYIGNNLITVSKGWYNNLPADMDDEDAADLALLDVFASMARPSDASAEHYFNALLLMQNEIRTAMINGYDIKMLAKFTDDIEQGFCDDMFAIEIDGRTYNYATDAADTAKSITGYINGFKAAQDRFKNTQQTFTFDIWDGSKGIIFAKDKDEAVSLFR